MIFAIDPGCLESAYVVMEADYRPIEFGKIKNDEMFIILLANAHKYWVKPKTLVIEQIASYGMAVGAEVFETCVWTGRFMEFGLANGYEVDRLPRKDVKMNLCGSTKDVNDAVIRKRLIDMFAKHDLKNGKGTAKNKDWFYGFKADIWAAYAVGVTYLDLQNK